MKELIRHDNKMNSKKLFFVQKLRGIACCLVFCQHIIFMYWYSDLSGVFAFLPAKRYSPETDGRLFYFAFIDALNRVGLNFGALAVAIFFLISGFTISITLSREKKAKLLFIKIIRIFPTYITGFSIGFLSIFLYCRYCNTRFLYGVKDYLMQITLTNTLFGRISIDQVSWTLVYTIEFYIFAYIIFKLGKLTEPNFLAGIGLVMACYCLLFSGNIACFGGRLYSILRAIYNGCIYCLFMMIGIVLYNCYKNIWGRKISFCVSGWLFFLFYLICMNGLDAAMQVCYIMSYGLALFIFVWFMISEKEGKCRYSRVWDFLGNISYSLYTVHALCGYIIMTVLDMNNVSAYIAIVLAAVIDLILTLIVHYGIEVPCNKFIKKIR